MIDPHQEEERKTTKKVMREGGLLKSIAGASVPRQRPESQA